MNLENSAPVSSPMTYIRISVIVTLTVIQLCFVAQACGSQVVSPRVDIRAPSEMVAGFPMPIELLVLGIKEIVDSSMLRDVSTFMFSLESDERQYDFIHNKNLQRIRIRDPRPNPSGHVGGTMAMSAQSISIPANTQGRFLLDLTHLKMIDASNHKTINIIEPGVYKLSIYARAESRLHGQQPTIEIMEPNTIEQRLIDRLAAIESDRPRWETFVLNADEILDGIPIVLLSEAGRRQLGYHLLLANLVHDPRDIAQLTIDDDTISQNLWQGYRTSVLLLRYEIALASDNQEQIELLKEVILQLNPTALKTKRHFEIYSWPIGRLRRLKLKQEEVSSQ